MMKIIALCTLIVCVGGVRATAASVDTTEDGYVVSGGIFLNDSYKGDSSTRANAPTCIGCEWKLVLYCDVYEYFRCRGYSDDCPDKRTKYAVFRKLPREDTFRLTGTICQNKGGSTLPKVHNAEREIRDKIFLYLPDLIPTLQPTGQTFTQLPTWYQSNQPTHFGPKTVTLHNTRVTVSAKPTWEWHFGDGTVITTIDPGTTRKRKGENYHIYKDDGSKIVTVKAKWDAKWKTQHTSYKRVRGRRVAQTATIPMQVKQFRSFLRQ